MKKEIRCLSTELRAVTRGEDEAESMRLEGYAAVFDTETEVGGFFFEAVAPGAFSRTIVDDDIRALLNHDPNFVLGRSINNTLAMNEDETGLHVEITLPNTQVGADTYASVQRGDISQMSFAFDVIKDEWEKFEDGTHHRRLLDVRLWDVSPVTYPAYPQTSIDARSVDEIFEEQIGSLDAAEQKAERESALVRAKNRKRIINILERSQ